MQFSTKNPMQIFSVVTLFVMIGAGTRVTGQNPLASQCARLANAIAGLNYHRSETGDLASGKIWRFEPKGTLTIFSAGTKKLGNGATATTARWSIEAEDNRCVFKITPDTKAGRTLTFRITDTTWAIVKVGNEERHIPDFEDHGGMKTRYCGAGDVCQKLWK